MGVRRSLVHWGTKRLSEYRKRVIEALTRARASGNPEERAKLFADAEWWSERARRLEGYLNRFRKNGRKPK